MSLSTDQVSLVVNNNIETIDGNNRVADTHLEPRENTARKVTLAVFMVLSIVLIGSHCFLHNCETQKEIVNNLKNGKTQYLSRLPAKGKLKITKGERKFLNKALIEANKKAAESKFEIDCPPNKVEAVKYLQVITAIPLALANFFAFMEYFLLYSEML